MLCYITDHPTGTVERPYFKYRYPSWGTLFSIKDLDRHLTPQIVWRCVRIRILSDGNSRKLI